jgi:aminopeptidase N
MDTNTGTNYKLIASVLFVYMTVLTACSVSNNVIEYTPPVDLIESDPLIDSVIVPKPSRTWVIPESNPKSLRVNKWDLVHQKIWVRFNFDKKQVIGSTELLLKSLVSHNKELILDSKTTEILSVRDLLADRPVAFVKDSASVRLAFDHNYGLLDSLVVRIDYVATPAQRGLYFVGPDISDPSKPVQVWTLGQPEDNSFWLPTIDHPAERTTTEQWISVPEQFTTVSNGVLIRSAVEAGDSLRTDYWVMDKPHAPYLIALAVGEYVNAEEFVHDVVLTYYAEPKFQPYLYTIYKDTSKMLRFFEDKLGVKYPWATYAQVPVREFIASGMENTTATIYFDQIQLTDRQQIDVDYQDLIVHELIHQWFGNLITTQDWANLPLNEGFANYFETLFRKHHDGIESAQLKAIEDRVAYFKEAETKRRPVIFDQYLVPEDMYDRHTYEKMGLILRMYHSEIGDSAWWAALNKYLEDNAWKTVSWETMKQSFESITERDETEFWTQWLLKPGHPNLRIRYDYSGPNPVIYIDQTHDTSLQPLYTLSIPIQYQDWYGNVYHYLQPISELENRIILPVNTDSVTVIDIDPDRIILAEIEEDISDDEWISRLFHPSVMIRYEAIEQLSSLISVQSGLIDTLIQSYHWERVDELRYRIMQVIAPYLTQDHIAFIHSINEHSEEYYRVRILTADTSSRLLGNSNNTYLDSLLSDKSYYVEKHIVKLLSQ